MIELYGLANKMLGIVAGNSLRVGFSILQSGTIHQLKLTNTSGNDIQVISIRRAFGATNFQPCTFTPQGGSTNNPFVVASRSQLDVSVNIGSKIYNGSSSCGYLVDIFNGASFFSNHNLVATESAKLTFWCLVSEATGGRKRVV